MSFSLDKISIMSVMLLACAVLYAAEEAPVITIKDHHFSPAELKIPAGKKIKLIIKNEDVSAEEFESYELRREKVVNGHSEVILYIGPLKAGHYPYFADFHPDAKGVIVAESSEGKN